MPEDFDVTEVVNALERTRKGYRKPLGHSTAQERTRQSATTPDGEDEPRQPG